MTDKADYDYEHAHEHDFGDARLFYYSCSEQ